MATGTLQRLSRQDQSLPPLAYIQTKGSAHAGPGGIYCPGYMSDMTTPKAVYLEKFFKERNLSFVRFDYSGLGESISEREWSFKSWRDDVVTILDKLTEGPQILIGSSLGGWFAVLAALARPHRIAGLVLIAPAVDCIIPSYLEQFTLEANLNKLLNKPTVPVHCPVRILHGGKDDVVPVKNSLVLLDKLESRDVDLIVRKSGEHRMNKDAELDLLGCTVEDLLKISGVKAATS